MDLVDIDKVLDDLELNEDNNNRQSCDKNKILQPIQIVTEVQLSSQPPAQHQLQNELLHSEQSLKSNNKVNNRQNFVNVSTVFSSLNDYVNAGTDLSTKLPHASCSNNDNESVKLVSSSSPSNSSSSASSDAEDDINDDLEKLSKINDESSLSVGDYMLDSSIPTTITTNDITQKSKLDIENQDVSNSLYSDTLSNDVMNLDGISSISSMVEVNMTSGCVAKAKDELNKVQKKIVGFESTMDDVSDTELESYLQELEYEIQNNGGNQIESCNNNNNDNSSIDNNENCDNDEYNDNMEKEEDLISQASTLDFNDLACNNIEDIPEPCSDLIDPKECSDMKFIDCTETESRREQVAEKAAEIVLGDDLENKSSTNEDKLTRPNSLDVPTSSVDVVNNQSSPGHTPPAIDSDVCMTLTSSSSDEFAPSLTVVPQAGGTDTDETARSSNNIDNNDSSNQLGKMPPYWIPDSSTNFCMRCNLKFSLLKRRHHCRACGHLLCSSCCCLKAKLEYMGDAEARICVQCDFILNEIQQETLYMNDDSNPLTSSSRQPNPNNPMEYCSVVPPLQQISQQHNSPISVMVPVGVLKQPGAPRSAKKDKNVMFSDGIRPGCDLADLDNWDDQQNSSSNKKRTRIQTPLTEEPSPSQMNQQTKNKNLKLPFINEENNSYIPKKENELPPVITKLTKTEYKYIEVKNDLALMKKLEIETLKFAIQRNLYVFVRIIELSCCINRTVINFTTHGMHFVGQDEIIILLELDDSNVLPKDIFLHLNEIYLQADKGNTITELGFSSPSAPLFLGKSEHGGFLYVRQTYQCLQGVITPESPYLIGILIHRWEVPWAKILPLRLMLRLGALYRYYPSPHVSVRGRDSVYVEIAQTIINLLADFRTYAYTIPTIRGMVIHIEDRKTSVLIPKNRYDQIQKTINNSSDHILALGGNFSKIADGHLVCIQNTESGCPEAMQYSTQAINIEGQPRKVTGASFLVLNGALKTSSGLTGKCSIVEDGLMVQILASRMVAVREALKTMTDIDIVCGPEEKQTEIVSIQWTENDLNFNIGVTSPIDHKAMDGVPSIRVHRGSDYCNSNHIIRWTEVFIIQGDDESPHGRDPIDMSKLSEQFAKSTCLALVSFLDLLAANGLLKIGLRITLDPENVCYEAGSQNSKLAPLYMNALDNKLIAILHMQASNLQIDQQIILELIFHILDK